MAELATKSSHAELTATAPATWRTPPATLELDGHSVHVWRILEPDASCPSISLLQESLSPDELDRADGFRFDRDRRRFILARGVLRRLIGGYVGLSARSIRFEYGRHGKPLLAGGAMQFNLSHTNGMILLAFATADQPVGVDVERVRPNFNFESVARRFLPPTEAHRITSTPNSLCAQKFFQCWTCKEAYAKARGTGLRDEFSRNFDAESVERERAAQTLHRLSVGPEYAAAVATPSRPSDLLCWRYADPG